MTGIFDHITTVYLLYLLYGTAFLFLGVSIAAKDMKGSELRLAGGLWLLGWFGFLHGAHEWLELGPLIEGRNLSFEQIFAIKAISAFLGVFSFLCLLLFGISLVRALAGKYANLVRIVPWLLFIFWVCYTLYFGYWNEKDRIDLQSFRQADIGARYTFGFVGGLLTAYGLIAYAREVKVLSKSVSIKLTYAGIAFAFYAVFAGLFSAVHAAFLPVPIELLRGVLAFVITYFIASALNIFDIETRKRIEHQSRRLVQNEKLMSLGLLAAGIAHEINNPLTNASLGIQTLKHRLLEKGDECKVVDKLSAVERNIDRASGIAQELLQFSRQQEAQFVPMNIESAIDGALTLIRYKLGPVTVRRNLASTPHIMGDPGKLEQVFINVLSNSLESMPEGGEIALFSFHTRDAVQVKISDTGSGIAAENLSRVFDPFFTTKEIGEGTGLGLSICYGIIKQHRGAIEISSALGTGTTVVITLPRKERYEKDTDSG